MLTFLLSTIGGAVIGGSYVLIRTPRSGKENQEFIKDFIETTQANLENVSEEASNLGESLNHLTSEVKHIQQYFIPEMLDIVGDFKEDAEISSRRIQHEMDEINHEIENMDFTSKK